MKEMKKAILISFLIVLVVPLVVMADTITMRRVSNYYAGQGGEFTIQINDNGNPDLNWVLPLYNSNTSGIGAYTSSFQTFCVEFTETISIGSTYNFAISDRAMQGGAGPTGDPISVGTAWLYYQFAQGILSGYNYTPGNTLGEDRHEDAGKLQATIWWLEGDQADPGLGNEFRNLVLSTFGSEVGAKADNNQYPVAVLNLLNLDGSRAQDQLVLVPEPGTILLLGAGLLGLAFGVRLRKRK